MNSINLNLQARSAGVLRTLWNRLTPTRGSASVAREIYFAAVGKPVEVVVTPKILYEKMGKSIDIFPGSAHYALALHRAGVTSFTLTQGISIAEVKDLLDTMISYRPATMIAKLKARGITITLE